MLWFNMIVQCVNNMFGLTLHRNPALCMLGILSENACKLRQWCRLALVSGWRVILRHWKSVTPSSFDEWLELMSGIAGYERVIFKVSGHLSLYMKMWGSFLALIEKMV